MKQIIFHAKKIYFQEYYALNKNHISNIWKGIKQLITISREKINLYQIQYKLLQHLIYFLLVLVQNWLKRYNLLKTVSLPYSKNVINPVFLTDTTPASISKLISSVDIKKSSGPKSVPTFILKSNIHLFSQIISFIVNKSFHEGVFPQRIKTAKVYNHLISFFNLYWVV